MEPLQFAAVFSTALGALVIVCRMVWGAVRRLDALNRLAEAQLQPNGGSSMNDAVKRTEAKVDDVITEVHLVKHDLADVKARLHEGDIKFAQISTRLDGQAGA